MNPIKDFSQLLDLSLKEMKKAITTARKFPPRLLDRVIMNKSVLSLLSNFGRDPKPERWIFIIGCYNSGTTILASLLNTHPAVCGLRTEGAFLTDSLPYPEMFGWPRMWCKCIKDIRLGMDSAEGKRAQRIKKHWSLWVPEKAPNVVEKTVSNAARMLFLQKYFKPAYFIYIVRNGYAVSAGIRQKANLKRWKNSEYNIYPIELCAEQWRVSDELVQKDRLNIKNFLQISYEEFTENSKSVVRQITDFLGISPMLDKTLDQGWVVHGERSAIQNMNKKSLDRLTKEDIRKIKRVCHSRLGRYGY